METEDPSSPSALQINRILPVAMVAGGFAAAPVTCDYS